MASEVAAFKGLLNNLLGLYAFLLFLLFRGTTHFNLFANAKELPGVALDKNTVWAGKILSDPAAYYTSKKKKSGTESLNHMSLKEPKIQEDRGLES